MPDTHIPARHHDASMRPMLPSWAVQMQHDDPRGYARLTSIPIGQRPRDIEVVSGFLDAAQRKLAYARVRRGWVLRHLRRDRQDVRDEIVGAARALDAARREAVRRRAEIVALTAEVAALTGELARLEGDR